MKLFFIGIILFTVMLSATPRNWMPEHRLVPKNDLFSLPITIDPSVGKAVNNANLYDAFRLIRSLASSPVLTHPDDVEIQSLAQGYLTQRHFSVVEYTVYLKGITRPARMAYNCLTGGYIIAPKQVLDTRSLAETVYHELMHEVSCRRLMRKHGILENRLIGPYWVKNYCKSELPSYAAQVRLFVAMHQCGLFDSLVVNNQSASGFIQTMEAWRAINRGNFCQWLQNDYAGKEDKSVVVEQVD